MSVSFDPWNALADHLDPPAPEVFDELADPVTLAAYCDPDYAVRSHLQLIGREVAALRSRWEAGEQAPRLMVNTPPQVGKSRTAVEWGMFWWMCLYPKVSIVIGCYDEDLAEDRGEGIRTLVKLYGERYGLRLQPGSSGRKDWSTTSGASVRSVGIASGITGHNADVMVIDDPIRSRADADSARKRDAAYNWYTADMLTRLAPRAPVIMIQTPWDMDDLRGRVIAQDGDSVSGGKWRLIVIPALATALDDPLGRSPGEPIPHPKVADGDTIALLAHWQGVRATQSVRVWQALYQCDPKPHEGALLTWTQLRERRCYEVGRGPCAMAHTKAVAVDPSGGGRDVAGVVAGYLGDDKRLYITHDRSAAMASERWSRVACELAWETDADRIIFERNYGGDMVALAIRTAWEALRNEGVIDADAMCPRLVPVIAKRGKLLRAEPIAQQWIEGRIFTTAYLPEFEAEWATYDGTGESPGRLDAGVYLGWSLLPLPKVGGKQTTGAGRQLAGAQLLSFPAAR